MFMLDVGTVVALALGGGLGFGLIRLYSMWRRWSSNSKVNDEIAMDKKIADAIKAGDVETIAKLRKYFLSYKKRHPEMSSELESIEGRIGDGR